MKIQGDEFLKNVQMKQEEEDFKQRINEYENIREDNFVNDDTLINLQIQQDINDDNELSDIFLQNSIEEKKINRKKYIVLGIALILLFIITIIMIRLVSGEESDLQMQEDTKLQQDQALNNEKIQQDYQQILNDKLKRVDQEEPIATLDETSTQPKEDQTTIQEEPVVAQTIPEPQEVVAEQTPPVEPAKPVVVAEPKKVEKKEEVKQETPSGTYVQIGAFSKTPANSFLSNITQKGYTYKLHNVTINGKKMIKVLVGPYSNRNEALNNLHSIRSALNAPSAFILKI